MPIVTSQQRAKANRDPITDPHIVLLEFWEEGRSLIHRAAINNEDVVHLENTYQWADITISLPGSSDKASTPSLEMSNLTRIPGAAINQARGLIICRMILVDIANPDVALLDTKNMFVITQASGDSVRISADLGPRADLQEPVPFKKTSRVFFPGVYFTA
jgi:hypothetical protein